MATVVMDAGHGGYDAGASNGDRLEKNDNLRMTLAIGRTLQSCGVNVIYTRDTDVFIPLIDRSRISNNANADLFVSIHRNSNVNPAANGFEVHTYTNPSAKSTLLANNIIAAVGTEGIQTNRGVIKSNFSVLRNTTAPAVLVEANFISNEKDNQLFDAYFEALVQHIAEGILTTLGINCDETSGAGGGGSAGGTSVVSVRSIQSTLNEKYGAGLKVDGLYGPNTKRALIRGLQIELNRYGAGLTVDGLWGPRTEAAVRLIRKGNTGNLVWLLQAALYLKGYRTDLDGKFGADTDRIVRDFQHANGLSADGIAGPKTFAKAFQ